MCSGVVDHSRHDIFAFALALELFLDLFRACNGSLKRCGLTFALTFLLPQKLDYHCLGIRDIRFVSKDHRTGSESTRCA